MEQQGKALKDCSVTELKAICYDLIAQREQNLQQLQLINQMIQEKSKVIPEVEPKE